jgi:non-specific serine/threonine protein kinase
MHQTLRLLPSGHLIPRDEHEEVDREPDPWSRRITRAFSVSQESGLFALAATRPEVPPSPSFRFWREFACRYLTELCRTPEGADGGPVPPLPRTEADKLLLEAPPMQGGEYLSPEVLEDSWRGLDRWVRSEVASSGTDLAGWLQRRAPLWHQVGRICFHLAENKNDPDYPFAFLSTYAPRLSAAGRVQYQPLSKALQEFAGVRNRKALIKLLSPVHRASETSPLIKELVDSGDVFQPLAWTPGEAYRFLKEVPFFEASGILVRLPDWWRKRPRPRVSITIGEKKKGLFNADAMLDFRVELALDGLKVTPQEWKKLMAADDGLVFIKGQWVEVDREKLANVLDHWQQVETDAAGGGISFVEGMRLLAGAPVDLKAEGPAGDAAGEWSFVNPGRWFSEILTGLRDPLSVEAALPGKEFQGTLRPYQEVGHKWLWFLSRLGLGACLADDMGLGKTVQVLSLLLVDTKAPGKKCGPALLVLPASLLANWKAEIQRFTPSLRARFVHPSESSRAELEAMAANPRGTLANTDLVLTTYGMLLRQQWMFDLDWDRVILDEAQAIKNPAARQTRAVKKLKSRARIALTGTPVENRLSDLWSVFDFLCPGLLGSASTFKSYIKSLDHRQDGRYKPLRNLVRPYILRRLKTDKSIIRDLPDKTELKTFCGLARKQAALYQRSVGELAAALDGTDGMQRRGLVLSYLMRFKQICNHPSNFLNDGVYDFADSGKFDRLKSLCEEIASRQEKVLVFTQFKEMTEPLVSFLAEVFGREGLTLHGGVAIKKRKKLIDLFQSDDGPPYFVLSLKAGGTGLNLTAASHVIHFDRWWNPAVENQATDRAFRIGQKKNVLVHKFICRGTVEEKIDELIEEKTALARDLLEGGAETLLTEMNDEDLLRLVTLNIDRATV